MLTGFGAFGTEPGILPPNGVPPVPGLTETAIVQLGKQMQEDQRCAQSNGEIYCLSKESHIYFGVGIAGGIALGALVGYMVG
jgi:hypothetical protein